MAERDSLEVDVLFVGGGPASLAGAIRLRRLAAEAGAEIAVMVIEKGGEIGNHGFSGAVVDPKALRELFPDEDITEGLDAPVSERRAVVSHQRRKDQSAVHAAGAEQPRQVRRLALEPHEVAGGESRRGRRRRVPGVSGTRAALGRRARRRRADRRQRRRARRHAQVELRTRSRPDGEGRRAGRRPARNAEQGRDPAPAARRGTRPASVRRRHQRALESPRPSPRGLGDPHARRAAVEHVRRRLDLRDERRHHRHRARHRARLCRPDDRSARQLPALQAPSRDPSPARRRRDDPLRREGDPRRRTARDAALLRRRARASSATPQAFSTACGSKASISR